MKTLQIVEPGCDGVFRHVEKLVAFLEGAGVDVDLAYSSIRPSAGLRALVEHMQRAGSRTIDLGIGPRPSVSDFGAAEKLIKLCRSERYDVLHAHSSKAGGLVRLLAPVLKTSKIFYTPNAYFGLSLKRDVTTQMFNLAERLLAPIGMTINVSNDEASFGRRVLNLPKEKSRIVANPVDCEWFVPATQATRAAARCEFSIAEDKILVGYASRFSLQKDPIVALEAFRRCALENPRLHLLYLCKRSLLSDAHAFLSAANITNRVTFVDYREDVRSFYHSLDMFLLTSRYEAGWPYVIIEAMSCGLPIVTSVCYGMSDVAEAKLSHCWTFPVGSVDGCEEALKSAARAGNFEGINHRVIAQKRFSVQACFGALLDLYRLPGYGTLKSEKLTQRREALV